MSLPSNRRPWLLLIAALIVGGCVGSAEIGNSPYPDDGEWIEDDDGEALGVAESDYETRAALARDVAPDEGDPEAEGLIIAPEVMTGYVGETLLLDLVLSNPDLGELRPASLPEEAVFEAHAGGASVEWVPDPRDVGQHDFVFLVVDANEPDLVLAQKTILVSVLPRFSLVEYGF